MRWQVNAGQLVDSVHQDHPVGLGSQDQPADLVAQDLPGHVASNQVLQDHPDDQVNQVSEVLLEQLVPADRLDRRDHVDLLDQLDHLDQVDCKVGVVIEDHQGFVGNVDQLDHKDQEDNEDRQVMFSYSTHDIYVFMVWKSLNTYTYTLWVKKKLPLLFLL